MIQHTKRISILTIICNLIFLLAGAQQEKPKFTRADTLRGSMNAERAYNVIKYDISFTPYYANKSISGKNTITYVDSTKLKNSKDSRELSEGMIQIDLQ